MWLLGSLDDFVGPNVVIGGVGLAIGKRSVLVSDGFADLLDLEASKALVK